MDLKRVDLGGPVHYADFGGSGEPMVLVHGLGGSLANWLAVTDTLTRRHRVFALDLAGFGQTPLGAERKASIASNVALVKRFIERVAGGPAVVAGNSMGGVIAALVSAERPDLVSRLILVSAALSRSPGGRLDPAVAALFGLYMTPVLGTLFLDWSAAKTSPEESVSRFLTLCGVNVAKLPAELLAAHVANARERRQMPWAHGAFATAARSLFVTTSRRGRFQSAIESIKAPTLLIQGTADRLVPLSTAQHAARIRPDWSLEVFEGVGHVPQLDVPDRWIEVVHRWLDGLAP